MIKIQNVRFDRNKSIIEINKNLINYIKIFSKNNHISKLLYWISSSTDLSIETLESETKIYIAKNFINNDGKFSHEFYLKNFFISSFVFFTKLFYVLIFSKRKVENPIFCELIVDDIKKNSANKSGVDRIDRFEKLSKIADTIFISEIKLPKKFKSFFFNYKGCFMNKTKIKNILFFF